MFDRGKEYSVTDLARIAGANPRSVQHWAASRILLAKPQTDRAGTGTRRLFSADEAIIACVMQALLERQTPVGEMLRVGFVIRDELLTKGFVRRGLAGKMIRGETQAWLVDFPGQDDPAAAIVQRGGGESFEKVFGLMKSEPIAIVIDLTAALRGLRAEESAS